MSDIDDVGIESIIGERIKRLRGVLMTQDDVAAAPKTTARRCKRCVTLAA